MTNSLTKCKGLTKPSAYGYNRVSAPDLALEETELGFVSFNANNVHEWNIDSKTEYNIMSMLQHMTMVGTAYQAAHKTSEEAIANVIISGFSGKLKGWWDNYLSDNQKYSIFFAIKVNDRNEPIIGDNGEPIPDAVNTLIFTIASHFIGKINNLNLGPQIEEQINNLKIDSSADSSGPEFSDDDINNIQVDDVESSSDSDVKQINVLSKDQDLLFDAIEAIENPEQKKD
ncbi:uncharacterized protein DS421_4g119420 [Arachis hypogaea]|nr:uncharacterized protein DS421_4g119420 [Arachis hypogaea]